MTTSSEETVRRLTLATAKTETGVAIWMMTEAGGEYVMGKDYDAMSIERDRLRQRVTALEAVVTQYASECGECGGKGHVPDGEAVTGRGPDDVIPNLTSCPECEDIRLALSGEK